MTIKTQEVTSTGIVLKSMPYKESDALITVYFKDYGKMTLVCKGVKKIKSKNAPGVQTLTLSQFTFIPRSGLCTLIKATGENYYRYIKEDIVLEAYASYFMEFVLRNEEENHPDIDVYQTLIDSLELLNIGYDARLVYLLFNAFILKHIGTPLQVDGCTRCHDSSNIVGLSLQDGGFVCKHCFTSRDMLIESELARAFRYINKATLKHIDVLNIDEKYYPKLTEIMDYYIDEFSGLSLKSRKFIKTLT